MRLLHLVFVTLLLASLAPASRAQDVPLNFLTIERPPFAFAEDGEPTGFSIELMGQIASELGLDVEFTFVDAFPEMLDAVARGEVDGAISNISITSEREAVMDFSRPIYESGLKVMISGRATSASVWDVVLSWDIFFLVLLAFGVLFGLGMLMWLLERRDQEYFNLGAREAMFPSFWWALNLVLNGGFEVIVPRTVLGRILGVAMVLSSLFLVSIFVANITAALTVEAITGSIQNLDDLDGRQVGTTLGSTASSFLTASGISHLQYASYAELIAAFEALELDAVVFDGPILSHYLTTANIDAHLLSSVFRPEDYGIALPQGSELREPINRVLLRLTETGQFAELDLMWFGNPN